MNNIDDFRSNEVLMGVPYISPTGVQDVRWEAVPRQSHTATAVTTSHSQPKFPHAMTFNSHLVQYEEWNNLGQVFADSILITWSSTELSLWTFPDQSVAKPSTPIRWNAPARPKPQHILIFSHRDLLVTAFPSTQPMMTTIQVRSLKDASLIHELEIPGSLPDADAPLLRDSDERVIVTVEDNDGRTSGHLLTVFPTLQSIRSVTVGQNGVLPRDALDGPDADDASSLNPIALVNDGTILATSGTTLSLNIYLSIWHPNRDPISVLSSKILWQPSLPNTSDRFVPFTPISIPSTSQVIVPIYEYRHSFVELSSNAHTLIRSFSIPTSSGDPTETWSKALDYPLKFIRYHPTLKFVVTIGIRDNRLDVDSEMNSSIIVTVLDQSNGDVVATRDLPWGSIQGYKLVLAESTKEDEVVIISSSGIVTVVPLTELIEKGFPVDPSPPLDSSSTTVTVAPAATPLLQGYKPDNIPAQKKKKKRGDTAGALNWVNSACVDGKRAVLFTSMGPEFVVVKW